MRIIEAVFKFIVLIVIGKLLLALIPIVIISIGLFFAVNFILAVLGLGVVSFPICVLAAIVIRGLRKIA
ncbi:MAG: hypothetical protein IJ874_07405 [Ruminococcus sp.]|nr:hypothetical protein [Ruminococcus sp.]